MKTTWTQAYLDGKMSPNQQYEWRVQQRAALEAETHVPWSHNNQNGMVVFRPYLDMRNVEPDFGLAEQVYAAIKPGPTVSAITTWMQVAETSGLTLAEVMRGAAALAKQYRINLHVDRMGKATFVVRRK